MNERRSIIVVSNRGPVRYEHNAAGDLVECRGAGGLVTALRPLVARHDVTWIASAMTPEERKLASDGPREVAGPDGSSCRLHLVAHDAEEYRLFYTVAANPALWFLQHGLWDLKRGDGHDLGAAWENGYERVNARFAEAVLVELARDPSAIVMFQDYHLYLAPAMVRAKRPEVQSTHFVHVPWAEPAEWDVLPRRVARAIHEGLLASDSVGFHAERWRAAFIDCCDALLGRGAEAEARSHTNPIAIDAAEFDAIAQSEAVRAREAELLRWRPEKLILRVDRVDPSKNAVRGFDAYARLLERRPDLHNKVCMLALLDPSREEIPEYAGYRYAVEQAADDVTRRFGRPGWEPLRLDVRDDFSASVAAYRQYDVLLVNPVRDGLNLVAKEAPLVNTRGGVLVLSRNAGAWAELGDSAIGVDPYDVDSTTDALETALELPPADRRARQAAIRERVRSHDLFAWVDTELAALDGRSTIVW